MSSVQVAATIIAKNGPIIIGGNNLIEERVCIINLKSETMTIGNHNVFEVYSECRASLVGNHNVLEAKSFLGENIELTNNCVIGAGCKLLDGEIRLQPYTVVSGSDLNKRTVLDIPVGSHSSQLDFLRKILPNYQKLWRPANSPSTPQQTR